MASLGLSKETMKELLAQVFDLFASEKELATTKIPFAKNGAELSQWSALESMEKTRICAEIWTMLEPVIDKNKDGYVQRRALRMCYHDTLTSADQGGVSQLRLGPHPSEDRRRTAGEGAQGGGSSGKACSESEVVFGEDA